MSGASGMQTLRQGWWHPPRRKTIDCNCFLVAVILVTSLLGHTSAQTSNMSCSTTQCYQNFSIPEDFPVGREVGRIDISHTYTDIATDKKQLADSTAVFNVNLATGVITTKAPLDRETTPTGYAFVLIPEKDALPVYVQIFLLDVNDNSPKFNPPNITLNFSESAPNVTKKALGSVTDPDLGMNSTATVMILSGNTGDAFSLLQKSLGAFDILLDLKVNSRLDYELVPSYSLVIIATDGGGKSGMMYVTINILDQNDNQPIFNASKYEVQLAENVTVGTKVIQVQATDQDSGDNGKIRYSIDSKSDPEAHFRIDPLTGEVSVNKPLDYETKQMFRLILEATDSGLSPLTGNAALDIKLLNINEQPADIGLTFLQGGDRQGHVLENIQKGTPVARISINDPDITIGLHMLVNVSLLGGDDVFGLQITDDVLSLVVVNSPPDREQKAVYELTVIVTDSGNPPLRASESFTVYIDDVNDNAPKFTKNPFEGEVPETAEIGTYVLRVNATDPDLGDNSRIVYSILGNTNPQVAWFQIDSNTGVITTQASINCEQNPQPTFVVTARDNGDPPLSGSTNVIITVRDVNNQQPVFDPSFYTVEVSEDADVGFCPLTVYGKDPECGARSPVTYEMVMNESTPTEFNVSRDTGNICIGKSLDYERNKNYEFLVLVIDRDGLSASAAVRVTVTDVNDNKPFFEPKDYSLNIENKKLPGPLIAVQGADLDSPPKFGTVTYSFVTNPAPELFSIDSGSGIISLVKSFPNETRLYTLFVQGTDGGGLVSDSPAKVNISIYSEMVHLPTFTLTMYNFTVSEDAPFNTLVGRVEATISGVSSGRAVIGYSIFYKSRNWFRIDNASGEIFTASPLDRETNPFVLLVVQAQTLTSSPLFASAQVNFTLLDINDNSPFFPASNILHIKVREDTQPPNPIYIAHAEDKDAGSNGFIKYRISNDPDGRFDIDEVSGEIYLKTILDYEECRAYQLLIIAEDQGVSGHRSTNMTLVVSVTDVNDNRPNFSQPLYDFYIREDAPIGFTFGRVNATDRDSDQNGRVSYSFQTTPYMSLFGIFTVDGVITTRDVLDREMQDLYSLTVMAIDHGTPSPLSASAVVRIHITDVNDNDPIFSSPEYKFTIQENLPLGSYVGQVYATDRDNGDNSRLQFQFMKTNQSKFVINTYNGEVTTLVALDREEQEDYILEVYVADSGATLQRSSTATIRVKVLDDNDNRPTFTIPDMNRSVSENRPKGTQVMKVVAQDPDAGENGTVSFYLDPTVETTTSTAQVTTSHGHHDITCTESRMEFSIPLSSPHTSETATLSDPNCQINLTQTHVRGGVDLNSCGTTVQFQNDSVIFRNAIIFSAPASSSLGSNGSEDSVSQYQDIIPIECVYNRIATVHLSYMPVVRRVLFTESGVGQFSFNIQQFWDASFTSVVSDRAYPLRLEQDADIFIQLSVGSEGQPVAGHKEIGMEVQQCLVSPSSSVIEAQLHYYPLIQDGCPASSDVHIIPNTNASDSTVMRFRFRAVNFFDPSSSSSSSLVFVHCRMGLCLTGSCKPSAWTCLTPPARRVRRDVDQSRRAAHQLSTGPFLIMADEASASSSSTTATVMAVVSTSVATVAIVVAAIALIALRRRRTTARN